MKHKKEWHTCDRCGKEIEEIPSGAMWKNFFRRKICTNAELRISIADRMGYVSKSELILPEISSVEIVESYTTKTIAIHLCGKCRKEFGRFLKNEH